MVKARGSQPRQELIKTRKVEPDRIVIFGRSLGGGIASWLASRHPPGVLILESTFTSLPDVAATLYPFMPIRLLLRFKYNTDEYLRKVNCPTLIIHSRGDEEIPFVHGQRIFEIASEPKEFLEITGTHNEGFINSGSLYKERLNMFIHDYLEGVDLDSSG